jgi:hypothetical protein
MARRNQGRLPTGWRIGLPQSVIECVLLVERYSARGLYITSDEDEQGYKWVRLCVGHPYANRHGWQRLHRYLMMRRLRRVLKPYQHVHHKEGTEKTTRNPFDLEVLEETDHGRLHCGRWKCGQHIRTSQGDYYWQPRDSRGRFKKLPQEDSGLQLML